MKANKQPLFVSSNLHEGWLKCNYKWNNKIKKENVLKYNYIFKAFFYDSSVTYSPLL